MTNTVLIDRVIVAIEGVVPFMNSEGVNLCTVESSVPKRQSLYHGTIVSSCIDSNE